MRERKIRARQILLREKSALKRELLFLRAVSFGIFVCFSVFRASFFTKDINFFGFIVKNTVIMIPAAAGTLVLLYFYFSHRLYFSGRIYGIQNSEFPKPHTLLKISTVLRYIAFLLIRKSRDFLWLLFFLAPALSVGVLVFRTFAVGGNIQRMMFFSLIAAFFLLAVIGFGFYFYVSGRYFLSELLFLRCTGQSPFEIQKNSAVFTTDNLSSIAFFRIRCLFTRGSVKGKMLHALFCSDLFYGRKFYKNYRGFRAVTFPEPS